MDVDCDFLAAAAIAHGPGAMPAALRPGRDGERSPDVAADVAPPHQMARALVAQDGAVEEDAGVDHEFLQLANMVGARARRSFEQRSWQHAQNARMAKRAKRERAEKEKEQNKRAAAEKQMVVSAVLSGNCSSVSLRSARAALSPEELGVLQLAMASGTTARGKAGAIIAQARAASLVSAVASQAQAHRIEDLISHGGEPSLNPDFVAIMVYTHEWDETSQRLQSVKRQFGGKSRRDLAQRSLQIIVQHGEIHTFVGIPGEEDHIQEPVIIKSMILEAQTADHIWEAMKRGLPFDLYDIGYMQQAASLWDAVVLVFACDRASANILLLAKTMHQCSRLPQNILPMCELCNAHGCALAKSKSPMGTRTAGALVSFSKLLRNDRTHASLQTHISDMIGNRLRIVYRRRPARFDETAEQLLRYFADNDEAGPDGETYFMKRDKRGVLCEAPWVSDLRVFLRLVDMSPDGSEIIHWCFVTEQSDEHLVEGKAIGSCCCADRREAVQKTTDAVINHMFGRAWESGCASRWLDVGKIRRRCLTGTCGRRLLPESLKELQTQWRCGGASLERMLEDILKEDQNDFVARQRLRLIRVCRSLCPGEISYTLAVDDVVESLVNKLLYKLLGRDKGHRVSMGDLADPTDSLVCKVHDNIVSLLLNWQVDEKGWLLLAILGADFRDKDLRLYARCGLIKACVGIFDHFDLKLSLPPYSLKVLGNASACDSIKMGAAKSFFDHPEGCLSLFCQRLRKMFPTRRLLVSRAPPLINAVMETAPTNIARSERAHADMRADLRSDGPGRSFAPSSNRRFCREMKAQHMDRGGSDPMVSVQALVDNSAASGSSHLKGKLSGGHMGNPYFRFLNMKMRSASLRHGQSQPLTAEEMTAVRAAAKEEWENAIVPDPEAQDEWKALAVAQKELRANAALVQRDGGGNSDDNFKGLWASSSLALHMLDPASVASYIETAGVGDNGDASKWRERIWQDSNLVVPAEVAKRFVEPTDGTSWRAVFGCGALKRNICRLHTDELASTMDYMDELRSRINYYIDNASKDIVDRGEVLLWCHRSVAGGGGREASASSSPSLAVVAPEPEACGDMIVIIAGVRRSPKMQFILRCHLDSDDSAKILFNIPNFPFMVKACVGVGRPC